MNLRSNLVSFIAFVAFFCASICANTPCVHAQSNAASSTTSATQTTSDVDILWGVKIPMRDGVKLNATVVRPKGQKEGLPVIFTFTPYIADSYLSRGLYFAKHGYVYALVDVRGRGNSEGAFEPFVNEGRDGHDVVEWLATQSWSNGKVTMWGGSYAGWNQWSTLKESPKHLATIVPAASCYPSVDFPMFKNIWGSYDIRWLTFTSGVTGNGNLFGAEEYWNAKFAERFVRHIPFKRLDSVVGNTTSAWQTWMKHPTPDAYWDAMSPTPEQYKRITAPILTITGHYDGDQIGAMEYYKLHQQHGSPEATANHFLIIGPWDHAGTRSPNKSVGGLDFGDACLLDLNNLHKQWYDWTMKNDGKNISKPEFLKKRVAYYVVSAEPKRSAWKYADNLESIATQKRMLLLASGGFANNVFSSGSLLQPDAKQPTTSAKAQREKAQSDTFAYNPLDVLSAERELKAGDNNLTDQSEAFNLGENGVVYHSEPFAEEIEITGNLKFTVWMSIDAPDADFSADVYEILPSGASVALTGDVCRARYRESLREAKPVKQGEITRYEFVKFPFFSRLVSKGSRLRLVPKCPNSIHVQKNYNSGGSVNDETAKEARSVRVTVYHDAKYPSALETPVVK